MRLGAQIKKDYDLKFHVGNLGSIAQAACLAHDIGNTPFGHAGEAAIQDWFEKTASFNSIPQHQKADFQMFDGNAMGFRILSKTEYDTYCGGMRLSFPTLAATIKSPWTASESPFPEKKKSSCLNAEKDLLECIFDKLKIPNVTINNKEVFARHPLAYVVEAADDICNNLLDLEDAREMGIVAYNEIAEICDTINANDPEYTQVLDKMDSERRKLAFIRGKTIDILINEAVTAFVKDYTQIMQGTRKDNAPLTSSFSPEAQDLLEKTQTICTDKIFNHSKKVEIELGAYTAIGAMLEAYGEAANEIFTKPYDLLSFKTKRVLNLLGVQLSNTNEPKVQLLQKIYGGTYCPASAKEVDLYDILLPFFDYLCGMTDNYATHISQQIMGRAAHSVRI